MFSKHQRILWALISILAVTTGTLAFAVAIRSAKRANVAKAPLQPHIVRVEPATRSDTATRSPAGSSAPQPGQPQSRRQDRLERNLSLQPEALKLAKHLGRRFAPGRRERSLLVGTLTRGTDRRTVHIARQQTNEGEQIEIGFVGSSERLTWGATEGALSAGAQAGRQDQALIERLVLDSPDQFVLAQLRGASYFTVARNVRPTGAPDDYKGPLWNIVRIDEPQHAESKRPESRWRLYYLDAATGLVGKVICRLQGESVTAEFTDWKELNGEKVPGRITWSLGSQLIMKFELTNFSHSEQGE